MKSVLAALAILLAPAAQANTVPQRFSFDGRITSASGTPIVDANVTVVLSVMAGACLLYEESQSVNTSTTDGYFSVQVGSEVGATKRTANDPGNSMAAVFQNAKPIASPTCSGTFTPTDGAGRALRVTVTPSSGTSEVLAPDLALGAAPMAMVAESLQGLKRSNVLELNTVTPLTQANVESTFSSTNFPALASLLAGTSGLYVKSNGNGASLPQFGSDPSNSPGAIWYDSGVGAVKFRNGSGVQTLGVAGSGLSSLNAGSNLSVNGSPGGAVSNGSTLDLASTGVTAGSYAKVTVDAKGRVTAGSALAEADVPAIVSPGKVAGDTITTGTIGGSTQINTTGQIQTTNSVQAGLITATNTVGIGTNAPLSPLHVELSGNTEAVRIRNTSSFAPASMKMMASTGATGAEVGYANTSYSDPLLASNLYFKTYSGSGGFVFTNQTTSSIFFIKSDGNVGIGNKSPNAKLSVISESGTANTEINSFYTGASSGGVLNLGHANGSLSTPSSVAAADLLGMLNFNGAYTSSSSLGTGASIYAKAEAAFNPSSRPTSLYFATTAATSPITQMVIASNGNIGIGTTIPTTKLHVANGNLRVQGTTTDCTLGDGSGGTSCSSDLRLKNHVRTIENALEKILNLRGVEFDWNEKSRRPGRHDLGVIAQEVEKVFPTAVTIDPNTGYRRVDYAVLVAPVIQAVKELNEKNAQLRADLKAEKERARHQALEIERIKRHLGL